MLNHAPAPGIFADMGASSADAYALAARHSARVRRLKVILPVVAGLIAAIFAGVTFVRAFIPVDLQLETATIEDGKIVMKNPAISGRNKQGISYSMKAQRALQDIANPDIITLQTIHAEMPMKGSMIATVDATNGIYDRGANTLDMNAPFTISVNNGINADFQSAYLDINAGEMETKRPVAISMKGGSIIAQTLRMTDKGRIVTFEGMVRVNIEPSAIRKNAK
ncbi:MAG TPA: LPS export ABC transporter periplasmic protein LptC [Ensifer sp.]|jgi:lipopolysaccharide export system protein LptC|uniref:LPS export ABC transporter periplasmic protein LptC n=1 Tax=Ensifer sp. TaxID=1872086 RepID=UPI002E162FCE|nr:LPS export ABC transporter periplasmic protein LptC [Ensifer sp.]